MTEKLYAWIPLSRKEAQDIDRETDWLSARDARRVDAVEAAVAAERERWKAENELLRKGLGICRSAAREASTGRAINIIVREMLMEANAIRSRADE